MLKMCQYVITVSSKVYNRCLKVLFSNKSIKW